MTREEAIKELSYIADEMPSMECADWREAISIAIKAIEQEPCEDAISRQAVLDGIADLKKSPWFNDDITAAKIIRKEAVEIVEALCVKLLPSVKQEPKTGRWVVTDDDLVYCSECEDSYYPRPIDASWYYCPHCGAKME